ncbi:MAG: hypothetical protein J6X92_00980 [Bacteroidales bacterium]|nr:hypothetical protein [Bacteroidales bacterium]
MKDTYDLSHVTDNITLTPSFTLPFGFGDVSFSDLVETNENIVFGNDKSARLIFVKDSAINIDLHDYVPFDTLISYQTRETIGDVKIANFSSSLTFSLDEMSQRMSSEIRTQLLGLDGSTGTFPSFTQITVGPKTLSGYSNFENATFVEGYIDVAVSNTLPIPLQGVTVRVIDTNNNSEIGSVSFTSLEPNSSSTHSINLAGKTISNTSSIELTTTGSDGASNVAIDMSHTGVNVSVESRDLKVSSGRIVIPLQEFPNLVKVDTLTVKIADAEVEEIVFRTGRINFIAQSEFFLSSVIAFRLPSVTVGDSVFDHRLNLLGNGSVSGSLVATNAIVSLSQDVNHPYNRIPFEMNISLSSSGEMVDFSNTSRVLFKYWVSEYELDYIKGYFGQRTENIALQNIDMEADNFLGKLTGSVSFANPEARIRYRNSFAMPIRINFNAFGEKNGIRTNLNLAPFDLEYPSVTAGERDKAAIIPIDNTNSSIADVMSTIPDRFYFSGSAMLNPEGYTGARDNYLFNNSRIVGDVEIELPLQFKCENLLFTDTLDNFLSTNDGESSISQNIDKASLTFIVKNGFPMSATASIVLYDPVTSAEMYEVIIPKPFEAAEVDRTTGRVVSPKETKCVVELEETFWVIAEHADQMIMKFYLSTEHPEDENVGLYSDYNIEFNIAASVKTNIEL